MEYDDSSLEVIAPDHDWTAERLPEKCLFAFLGDVVHKYAKENNADMVEELITVSHNKKIYVLHEEKEDHLDFLPGSCFKKLGSSVNFLFPIIRSSHVCVI